VKLRLVAIASLAALLAPEQSALAATSGPLLSPWLTSAAAATAQTRVTPALRPRRRKTRTIWRVATGLNFSRGTYGGTIATEVISVPMILRVRRGRFSARISVPFVAISGPAAIVDTGGPGGTGGSPVPTTIALQYRSGLGDLSLGAGYSLPLTPTLTFDATGRIKFPTASKAKRLTTGSTDVILQGDLTQRLGKFSLHAGGRRRFAGHSDILVLRDTWGATAGFGVSLRKGLDVGVDYDWQQSSIAGNAPNSEVTAWAGIGLSKRLRVSAYAGVGTSSNSPDFAVGTAFSIRLD
jgi:hypothetical protein